MAQTTENPARLRPAQAAQTAGVSKPTLLRWEKLFDDFPRPSRPSDRVTLYDRERLLAWLDSREKALA